MCASWGDLTPSLSRRLTRSVAVASVLLLGCGVDDRTLSLGQGAAGAQVVGGSAATGGASSAAGSLGTAGSPDSEIPVCVYDGAVSADCATLVDNAGFASETTPWKAEEGLLGAWDEGDATDASNSGSIRVINFLHGDAGGVAPGAAVQCIRVTAGKSYDLATDVFITEGQGEGTDGEKYTSRAGIGLFFFRTTDCTEDSIGNADAPMVRDAGEWLHTQTTSTAPEQAQSASVRLATLMPFRQFKFQALFDNVLVRERP